MESFNLMQTVKRRLYAMRNGALAAQMRRGGLDYRINFGLNIPQIKEIATDLLTSGLTTAELISLAVALWENVNTRESRLLAPMLYPVQEMNEPLAMQWLSEAQTTEVADHLCHSLLRQLPYALQLPAKVLDNAAATPIQHYTAMRLAMNLLVSGKLPAAEANRLAEKELASGPDTTKGISRQMLDEAAFRLEYGVHDCN